MDDGSQPQPESSGGDRLSNLEDRALGHILSFLPAKEAGRAALLSSRWRDVFAAVHTVSLEEPEGTKKINNYRPPDPKQPPPFSGVVSLALLARNRRRGAVPLRALRVAMDGYRGADCAALDQWVSYAVQQAAPDGLDLELRFRCCLQLCRCSYSLGRAGQQDEGQDPAALLDDYASSLALMMNTSAPGTAVDRGSGSDHDADDDDDSVIPCTSDDDDDRRPASSSYGQRDVVPEHSITPVLFSCTKLRSLSLSSCRLAPPTSVIFPSLETLLLSHVSDPGSDVERLITGCPRLADLTLEACDEVTALCIPSACLRRLALRCCGTLAAVVVNGSELEAFEYSGGVPESSFLTIHGGSRRVAYCKIDVCGEEVSSEELINLTRFLQMFENAKHLHLESARLCHKDVKLMEFPTFSSLRHLELRGRLSDDDIANARAVISILEHTPNLEVLSLFFHPEEVEEKEKELAHHLSYNPHSILESPPRAMAPCLRSKVREINLVHYQGGRAQRTLAKFLLCNAPVIVELRCEFAEGPLWTQTADARDQRLGDEQVSQYPLCLR